ncbi:hypothetical protein DFP73DRAFT_537165 [Morchella snyderi]|nr:hypothetical protein DFP73DRAFT_537165 [Morchella snyderi]
MHSLLRPNTVSMLQRFSISRRAAFHMNSSLLRKASEPIDTPETTGMPFQEESTNPAETFSTLDVLGSIPAPPSAVDAAYADGFLLNNGTRINDGVMLLNSEAFVWKPIAQGGPEESKAKKGVLELTEEAWGLLDVVYPKPELLILGTGHRTLLLSPKTKARISELGIRLDVMSTRSAAAQYNLLATERTGAQVAAAMLVDGFGK